MFQSSWLHLPVCGLILTLAQRGLLAPSESVVRKLSEKETEIRWTDLADDNAAKAYQAICHLAGSPDLTVAFLKKHLKPVQSVAAERIDKLIAQLDDQQFAMRQNASAELEKLGELAVPSARKALKGKLTAEARRRLEQLLNTVKDRGNISGDRLRTFRTIEVLERIGTSEARQFLQELANGAPGALQTEEAKESLQRLKRQDSRPKQGERAAPAR